MEDVCGLERGGGLVWESWGRWVREGGFTWAGLTEVGMAALEVVWALVRRVRVERMRARV